MGVRVPGNSTLHHKYFWQQNFKDLFPRFIIYQLIKKLIQYSYWRRLMNDVCRSSRDHVVECSERTVLSCLEPVCLCWRRFGRYFSHHLAQKAYLDGA